MLGYEDTFMKCLYKSAEGSQIIEHMTGHRLSRTASLPLRTTNINTRFYFTTYNDKVGKLNEKPDTCCDKILYHLSYLNVKDDYFKWFYERINYVHII